MRRIISSVHMTLDGYMSGPSGDEDNLDWALPNVPDTLPDVSDLLDSVDTILLGRITYEGFSGYWPTATGGFAGKMNATPKIVFSRGASALASVDWGDWGNARLIDREVQEEVGRLKRQAGKDMVIFASSKLVQSLTDAGLVDQFRIVVHPVVLGSGKHLFDGIDGRRQLTLVSAKPYPGGAVSLTYDVME